jgi:hypothetical protein
MIQLAANANASGQARALATLKVADIKQLMEARLANTTDENWKAHYTFGLAQIRRFENNPEDVKITDPLDAPDGSPIGQGGLFLMGSGMEDWCGHAH